MAHTFPCHLGLCWYNFFFHFQVEKILKGPKMTAQPAVFLSNRQQEISQSSPVAHSQAQFLLAKNPELISARSIFVEKTQARQSEMNQNI